MPAAGATTRRRTRSSASGTLSEAESDASASSVKSAKNKRKRVKSSDTMIMEVDEVLHREDIVKDIKKMLAVYPPFLFITGPPGSGKSSSINNAVTSLSETVKIATVDMRDVLKVQGFFHAVLSQLISEPSRIPDHTSDFVRSLNTSLDGQCVLIVEHGHLLNSLNSLLFCTVTRLYQLTCNKVSVVLVSDSPWDLIYSSNGSTLTHPLILYVPPYTRQQMIDVITQHLLDTETELCSELGLTNQVMKSYVTTCIYDSLSPYTSSIREMMRTSRRLLPQYVEPLRKGELKMTDTIKLFQRVQSVLVDTMSQLGCLAGFKSGLELPYNSRVLLICAFLASHNPARLDKRFFCKAKSSRRKVKTRTTAKLSEVLKGPKTFPLDRLLAIFSAVTQDGTIPCSDVLISVSSLVSLNLIVKMSVDLLDQPKYKCLVPLPVVQSLAKESGVDLERFYFNY